MGRAQVEIRCHLQGRTSQGRRGGNGALAGLDGTVMIAQHIKIGRHKVGNPCQPPLIAQGLGEDFGLAEVVEDLPKFSEMKERRAQAEPEVDGLLERVTTLREMLQGHQR
jgi:hypothetical protein